MSNNTIHGSWLWVSGSKLLLQVLDFKWIVPYSWRNLRTDCCSLRTDCCSLRWTSTGWPKRVLRW
jgi:hypothetical protein